MPTVSASVGDGWMLAMKTFERSRPGIAAQAVGISRGATDLARQLRNERKQFGKPIGEHQMVARDAGRHGHPHGGRAPVALRGG